MPEGDEAARRAALADWLADEKNPLTWRSIANRVWHYHFGRGICDTPNDFGRMGGTPSHPELLDWLACELRDHGGSLKHLHRLIVTSARLPSEQRPPRRCGETRWRQPPPLAHETVSGSTRTAIGTLCSPPPTASTRDGRSERAAIRHRTAVQLTPTLNYEAYDWGSLPKHRRSIYRFVWRGVPDPFMETLDFPDLGMLAPTRGFFRLALQSLALYNNRFVLHFSDELGKQLTSTDEAVRRILLREPTAEEGAGFAPFAQKTTSPRSAGCCSIAMNSSS